MSCEMPAIQLARASSFFRSASSRRCNSPEAALIPAATSRRLPRSASCTGSPRARQDNPCKIGRTGRTVHQQRNA